jgi:hypothetical protein
MVWTERDSGRIESHAAIAILNELWNRRTRTTPALRATPPYPRRGFSITGIGLLYADKTQILQYRREVSGH